MANIARLDAGMVCFRNKLGRMQASSSSPVMIDAKPLSDVQGPTDIKNDGRSLPNLDSGSLVVGRQAAIDKGVLRTK